MPYPTTAKFRLIEALAEMIAVALVIINTRVRYLAEDGLAPSGIEPLYDRQATNILLGLLASGAHIDGPRIVRQFIKFSWTSIDTKVPAAGEAVGRLFPSLASTNLGDFLSRVLHDLREGAPYHVGHLAVDMAPHNRATLRILPPGGLPYVDLEFSDPAARADRWDDRRIWPLKQTQTIDGRVLAAVAEFSISGDPHR